MGSSTAFLTSGHWQNLFKDMRYILESCHISGGWTPSTLLKPLMLKLMIPESERRDWKSWLKAQHSENEDHGIQSHHFMGNGWENGRNSDRLYFQGLQNHCRWWLQPWNKRWLLLGKKAMTNPDSVFKRRNITLLTKVCLVKAMVFPVVMYGCESWITKKGQ